MTGIDLLRPGNRVRLLSGPNAGRVFMTGRRAGTFWEIGDPPHRFSPTQAVRPLFVLTDRDSWQLLPDTVDAAAGT